MTEKNKHRTIAIPSMGIFYSESSSLPVFIAFVIEAEQEFADVFLVTAKDEQEAAMLVADKGYQQNVHVVPFINLFRTAKMFADIEDKLKIG